MMDQSKNLNDGRLAGTDGQVNFVQGCVHVSESTFATVTAPVTGEIMRVKCSHTASMDGANV